MHTVKPIDEKAVIDAAKQTKGIVVCEEHTVVGGLASAVDEIVAENYPVRVLRVGIKNHYGQSGDPEELMGEYHLTTGDLINACRKLL